MLRAQTFLIVIPFAVSASAADFSGASALKFTREAVALGPRPAGSEANRKLQAYILRQLKADNCQVTEDAFTAKTPANGEVAMQNIIAKFPGKARSAAGD